jgi:hypothetical protein
MTYLRTNLNEVILGLRWLARIWSMTSLILLFLFFVGEGIQPGKLEPQEWLGLLFFPIGIAFGLLIAWQREGLGGAITVLSLLAFYFVYGLLLRGTFPQGWVFLIFAAPGFIYLMVWWLSRQMKNVIMS